MVVCLSWLVGDEGIQTTLSGAMAQSSTLGGVSNGRVVLPLSDWDILI